ncbi:MAG: hypothetical protein K2X67_13660 [Burkholderiales bacterium]|nr:hypothetical protein [Burkholderiales bacterium]
MKLIPIIGVSAFALALSGAAFAAEQSQQNPAGNPPQAVQDGGGDVNSRDRKGDDAQRERDYQAELKKCDAAADKAKCQDAAKKKFNQM